MRNASLDFDPEDLEIASRLTDAQRSELEARIRAARSAGHAVTILFVHAPRHPACWLEGSVALHDLGDNLYLVAFARCHIDRGCALAERMVRLARDPRVRVGVAQVLPHTGRLDATFERAEQALSQALSGEPVASMHWADTSREFLPAI